VARPAVRGRVLYLPAGWDGAAAMLDMRGKSFALTPAGKGRFALPARIKTGVYLFKVGPRAFFTSVF
jgi:hypothetical protein